VTKDRTRDWIAALERAREQMEAVLCDNADWQALRRSGAGSTRIAHELALAGNPLYRSWGLLNEAIQNLRSDKPGQQLRTTPGAERGDVTRAQLPSAGLSERLAEVRASEPDGPVPAASPQAVPAEARAPDTQRPVAPAQARSIELSHILQHIRDAAPQHHAEPAMAEAPPAASAATATNGDDRRSGTAAVAQHADATSARAAEGPPQATGRLPTAREAIATLAPAPEEATVTFVIREHAPAGHAGSDVGEGVQEAPLSDQWAAVEAEDSLYPAASTEAEEAEVVIVTRRPDSRRSRKA
jgi:hypothetical protein